MDLVSINTYFSFLSGLFMVGLGILVFLKKPKEKLSIIFLFFCLAVATWLLATFIMYKSKTDTEVIFWDKMVYVGVVFIPVLMYHFGLVFTNSEKRNRKKLYLGYFFSFVFLALSRTDYFVASLYKYSWGVHTQAKIFHHIFLLFFFFYILLFLSEIYNYLKFTKEKSGAIETRQVKYLLLSFITMNMAAYAYLPAYGIDVNPIGGYWFETISVILLTFVITKYHLFEIKVILTELLIGVMGIILLVQLFFAPTSSWKISTGITFCLFCLFGYYLVKASHEESKRREEAEALAARERVLKEEAEKLAKEREEVAEEFQIIAVQSVAAKKRAEEFAEKEKVLRQKSEKLASDLQRLTDIRNQMFLTGHHHTRTPLAHIKNFASLLFEGFFGRINEKQTRAVKIIIDKVQESIDLADLYLSVAQLEAGEDYVKKEKTDFIKIIKEQIKKFSSVADLKNIKITLKFGKDLPEIMADSQKLGTVIYTLIDNAIKYSPEGKRINIQLNRTEKEKLLFSCQDFGIGVKKEDMPRIGKIAYQRTEEAKKVTLLGKGLALYLSNLIVEAHAGKLWAESKGLGKGTTFYVELPIK